MSKTPSIGELRQVGTLEKNVPILVGTGYKDNYSGVYVTVTRGKLENKTVNRVLETGETIFADQYKWTCRFEKAIEADMKKSHRWRIGTKTYSIEGYKMIDEKRFFYEFHLSQQQ